MELDAKGKIISGLLRKGVLTNRDILGALNSIQDADNFYRFFETQIETTPPTTESFLEMVQTYREQQSITIQKEVTPEKPKTMTAEEPKRQTSIHPDTGPGTVKIITSYEGEPKKREVQDFVKYFNARYNSLKKILQNRKELMNLTSINRIKQRKERAETAIIGLVKDKQTFKSGTIKIEVEDPTDTISILVKSDKGEAYDTAKEIVMDEVIGVVGMNDSDVIYANSIIQPDVPLFKELKKSPDETYALFMGDFHFGSNVFLTEAFDKFISWIRADQGSDIQKETARKVKYLFLLGDLVEGVGIYPKQEDDLVIKDIYEQYNELAKQLARIPSNIKIIICPGNHDAMRIAEPQPPLYKDFAEAVWKMPNVTMVSSPSMVNIHSSDRFPGFEVLMYHGFSFIYYADAVESIRSQGGQKRPDLIMKFLLKRRHLAPTHKSTLYLPDANYDPLVIDKIPDIFATGHIHRVSAANYRNVTLLNCSAWLKTTEYQEKVGITPQSGRAILVNLKSRKVKILKFYDDPNEDAIEFHDQ